MDASLFRQPFELLPNRVWRTYRGGAVLDRIEGKAEPADGRLPEDWIGSAVAASNPARGGDPIPNEGLCTARAADGSEILMPDLLAADPEATLGAAHVAAFGVQPALLVKFIDSAVRLSIQAHPSIPWAAERLGVARGKTEAWWILETREADAWVLAGFQRPPEPEAWRRMMAEQDSEAMLACFDPVPVASGDIILIEGGLPHAIGPGITMIEIQEPSDFVVHCEFADKTLKISDEARTMGLGIDAVVDMFDYTAYTPDEVKRRFGPSPAVVREADGGRETALLAPPRTELLEARRIEVDGDFEPDFDGRYSIVVVLDGEGVLETDDGRTPLTRWTRLFLPAALDAARIKGRLTIARALPPKPPLG